MDETWKGPTERRGSLSAGPVTKFRRKDPGFRKVNERVVDEGVLCWTLTVKLFKVVSKY